MLSSSLLFNLNLRNVLETQLTKQCSAAMHVVLFVKNHFEQRCLDQEVNNRHRQYVHPYYGTHILVQASSGSNVAAWKFRSWGSLLLLLLLSCSVS